MNETKRPLKVFLCHASGDKPKVRELYSYLKRRGVQPWLDAVDLLAGQNWQTEIPKALESSDTIIICLSKGSVDKAGYVQKEIKFALDKALEMPEGHIFIIPARFDECNVPYSLINYHWVDLFNDGGYEKLMESLKHQATQLQRTSIQTLKLTEAESLTEPYLLNTKKPVPTSPTKSNLKAKEQHRKLKTEYIVAIIGAAAILIAALIGISPQIFKTTIPPGMTIVATTTVTQTSTASLLPTQTLQPSLTPTASFTPTASSTPTASFTPTLTPLPTEITDSKGVLMRLIPEGKFTMGIDPNEASAKCKKASPNANCSVSIFENQSPAHSVYLDNFYIDKFEVTNFHYQECVIAEKCNVPLSVGSYLHDSYYDDPEFKNYPVTNVNWYMANTYCQWRGMRLPTEAEWEKAARGTDQRIYPWGNEFNGTFLNYCDENCKLGQAYKAFNDGAEDTSPVGNYPQGISPYGVFDMAGNVAEWVSDSYQADYYATLTPDVINPLGPEASDLKVIKGGAWNFGVPSLLTTTRSNRHADGSAGSVAVSITSHLGFRCASNFIP